MKKVLIALTAMLLVLSCASEPVHQPIENSVVYEMNVRQYTPEGTFAAAQKQLPRLKDLGIDIVWLMPIHPIGTEGRKGTLGSYYAIRDYKAINPEFGTMQDFENFLAEAHRLGLRVVIDCVANHTSPDAVWTTERAPEWYERDSSGKTTYTADWSDTANLNYDNNDVWQGMTDAMRFWMEKGIDGFRCDMACEVPLEFWKETIAGLRADYPGMYMLAEGEEPKLHSLSDFDASYAWELHHLLNSIARGEKNIPHLLEYVEKDAVSQPSDAFRLMFTSNHDENSWAGTEFERMGDAAKVMAVLTFTLPGGQPLIYTGQEMGWNHRFQFFEKDPIPAWEENEYTDFYKWLIKMRHDNPALAAGDKGGRFEVVSTDDSTLVFTRTLPDNKVTVKAQLKAPWSYQITVDSPVERIEPLSWWTGMKMPLQLLIQGEDISDYDVTIEGGKGVSVSKVHKADSPNYLFVDVKIASNAKPGIYDIVFTKDGKTFRYPYEIAERKESSAQRQSFTSADMIYLIMPDRFANGDPSNDTTDDTLEPAARDEYFGRHGGDIQGVVDHLDYIADLGATVIWSTPMLEDDVPNESYHGYACTDYYHIDPRMGSNELYREFVQKAHQKDIKVIMDVVTNHCGTSHWWMEDLPFNDWIHQFPEYTGTNICFSTNMDPNASKEDLNIQESGWFVPSMPDMNLNNPFVLQYFKQWAVWWIEYASLDGFRVDTYPYNEKEPMSQWCAAVREEYPGINIVGECWTSSIPQLAYWQDDNQNKDGFDSNLPAIMDFPLHDAIRMGLPEDNPGWGQGMTRVYDILSHDFVYEDLDNMMIFGGNHDVGRIGDVVRRNPDRLKIAMAMMATMRGIPQIFAGDELMFMSANVNDPWSHGGLRTDFPGGWPGDRQDFFSAEGRAAAKTHTDGKPVEEGLIADLYDYVSRLFQWRKTKDVIHDGNTLHFMRRDNTYGYFRYDDDDVVFVYINNSNETKNIPWTYYKEISDGLSGGVNVITGGPVEITDDTVVAPQSVLIVEYRR